MSIVIKSNVKATASLGNIHGLNGPTDFDTMLNFERGFYSVGGTDVSLSDVLSFTRASAAEYLDESGVRRVAAANAPRIHRLASGRSGFLMESESTNLYPNPGSPTTQTVSVPLVSGALNYVSLRVWGTGSATISTDEPNVGATPSLTATESSPVMLVFSAGLRNISVTVTISGSVSRVNLASTPGNNWGEVLPTPVPLGTVTRAADVAALSPGVVSRLSNTAGTIVAAYSRNPALVMGDSTGAWFSIRSAGGSNLAGLHVDSTSKTALRARGYDVAGAALFSTHQIPMADTQSRTIAIAWEGGGSTMRFASNGLVSQFAGGTIPPITGLALSGTTAGIAYTGRVNAALTHLVHYDRALSAAELQEVTSSWA